MTNPVTLMQVEAAAIQDYIFGSNNLQQNIGASELVKQATTQWVIECFGDLSLRHNARWNTAEDRLEFGKEDESEAKQVRQCISSGEADVEVIYAGGGNALLLFMGNKDGLSKSFIRCLSQKLIDKARDLHLLVETIEIDFDRDALSTKHNELRRSLARKKLAFNPNAPLGGLGVTAACDFTGQPVVGRDSDGRLVSRCVLDKLAQKNLGKDRLHTILPQARQYYYEFVENFDLLGERGKSRYLAVVHIDGNQMGERFQQIATAHPSAAQNDAYINQLYRLSLEIQNCSTAALRQTVDTLIAGEKNGKYSDIVPIPSVKGQTFLPFRPIVFGGDDATFVCEGRLGLALAAIYLQALAARPLPGDRKDTLGDPLYARAGVAVVKSHFPFSLAYELAEDLCSSAKQHIEERIAAKKGCILDWHFSTTGVISTLGDIRVEEYTAQDGSSLLMRPLWVQITPEKSSRYWQTWDNFNSTARTFATSKEWVGHNNKRHALQEALRSGPEAVALFIRSFRQPQLPDIPGQTEMPLKGWQNHQCGYFDNLEASDFYVPLQKPGDEA